MNESIDLLLEIISIGSSDIVLHIAPQGLMRPDSPLSLTAESFCHQDSEVGQQTKKV